MVTRERRRAMWAAAAVAVAASASWLPGVPLRAGPLEGTTFEELHARTDPSQAGILWGSLLLHNPTGKTITIDGVRIAGNPQALEPSAGPYIWDVDRYELLGTGAISAYQLPLPPAKFTIPPRHEAKGFRIPPHAEEDSIEVVYEFPIPTRTSELHGITVSYHVGGLAYRKTYDIHLTICAPNDPDPCDQL
ncbi:hypothetical protein AB0J83_25165 [Actinoplanes sp. NPDC049596]|uniref:hypothetical protein n=1 Tax=unclassified Actinoplanes TaxID=2626549 RepID=UPI00343124DD